MNKTTLIFFDHFNASFESSSFHFLTISKLLCKNSFLHFIISSIQSQYISKALLKLVVWAKKKLHWEKSIHRDLQNIFCYIFENFSRQEPWAIECEKVRLKCINSCRNIKTYYFCWIVFCSKICSIRSKLYISKFSS